MDILIALILSTLFVLWRIFGRTKTLSLTIIRPNGTTCESVYSSVNCLVAVQTKEYLSGMSEIKIDVICRGKPSGFVLMDVKYCGKKFKRVRIDLDSRSQYLKLSEVDLDYAPDNCMASTNTYTIV